MKPVLLVDAVGLTPRLIGERTPNLARLAARAPMTTVLPAVTCSAQATLLTGTMPAQHGAVGNGWLARKTMEVALWRQSNALVSGEKVYEAVKRLDPSATVAKIFWWWNLGAAVDWSITPRPFYPADGRKLPAVYGWPTEYAAELERELGAFPFFDFWGPKSGLPSTRWLADAAIRTLATRRPALTMVYLPHLDYDFQRFGPDAARSRKAVEELDVVIGDLLRAAERAGAETMIVSEYGITAVTRPVHVNRALREAGLLVARETPAGEVLDVFGSRAFAVSDHQVAHVYTKDRASTEAAAKLLGELPGVDLVLGEKGKKALGLDHIRAGDIVLVSKPDAWFTYYYWLDDRAAPDFARTVDIHRKPGYDPCELFLDPTIALPKLRVARRLAQKKLGMRYLMDVIPLDATLVKGSHGRLPDDPRDGPVFLCTQPFGACGPEPDASGLVAMTSVKDRVLALYGVR
ncbi:MAG: alkaline phosphatase family protein [Planctomycetes bacterium]|nr:alkaline phosphatase family protein [Planctomycetota bacterium]